MAKAGRIQAVLSDLDGTLVDTAPDLVFSLNEMRSRRGLPHIPEGPLRAQASHGTQGLIRLGFDITPEQPQFAALRTEFLEIYIDHLTSRSGLFPKMAEVLDGLDERGVNWAVVTNKPAYLTEPLLRQLQSNTPGKAGGLSL